MSLRYEPKPLASGALLQRSRDGCTVVDVRAGTPAAERGLQSGDVVIRAGDQRRPPPAAVEKLLMTAGDAPIVVTRGDRQILLEPAQ
jgi:C-terminal processing protease CtpA/Prc